MIAAKISLAVTSFSCAVASGNPNKTQHKMIVSHICKTAAATTTTTTTTTATTTTTTTTTDTLLLLLL